MYVDMSTQMETNFDIKTQKPLKALEIGDKISHIFRVEAVEFNDKGDRPWLTFKIGDSTSTRFAKKWNSSQEEYEKYKDVKYIVATGSVTKYKDGPSLKLESIVPTLPYDCTEEDKNSLDYIGEPQKPARSKPSRELMFVSKTKQEVNFENLLKTQKPLKDLVVDDNVEHIVRIAKTELKQGKGTFVLFTLADATGVMKARQWNTDEETIKLFNNIKAVYVKGFVETYEPKHGGGSQTQIEYEQLCPITDATDIDANVLYTTTTYNVKDLKIGLWKTLQGFKDPYIKKICESLVKDEKNQAFSIVPAGISRHHSWRNGLLEHTYRLIHLIDDFLGTYKIMPLHGSKLVLNRDTILAGALYHDFFKCHEYTGDCGYSPRGNLLKHLSRGIFDIAARSSKIENFPELTAKVLAHIVAAHHRLKEWDTVDTATCPEALAVHYFDNLCSKLEPTLYELNKLPEGEKFTSDWVKAIDRKAFVGSCTYDTFVTFPVATTQLKDTYGKKELEAAIREMLTDIKNTHVKDLCERVLDSELDAFKSYSYSEYKFGLLEFTYRTMFAAANFSNSFNSRNWPQNRLFLNPDFLVGGMFLQNYFKFRENDPIAGEISSFFTSIGKITAQISDFPMEVIELLGQIVAAQYDEESPEDISCPESIVNHYIRDVVYNLDYMLLKLGQTTEWETSDQIELFGKKINKGTCSEMGN